MLQVSETILSRRGEQEKSLVIQVLERGLDVDLWREVDSVRQLVLLRAGHSQEEWKVRLG